MTERLDIENLARQLREAAFPGAKGWAFCAADVRERWLSVAALAHSRIERAVDQALREAAAKAHELGQHAADIRRKEPACELWKRVAAPPEDNYNENH